MWHHFIHGRKVLTNNRIIQIEVSQGCLVITFLCYKACLVMTGVFVALSQGLHLVMSDAYFALFQ